MTVKAQDVEKEVDKRKVVPSALISCASHRIDCTLPSRLTERELRNRSSAAIRVRCRLELQAQAVRAAALVTVLRVSGQQNGS